MDQVQIDWFTVIVAAILNMVIGYFWYSKWLFGDLWMKLRNIKQVEKPSSFIYLYLFIASLFIAYFLAFFENFLGITTVTDGMFVGFCFWLGFVATTLLAPVLFEKQPIKLFAIHAGYRLLAFLVMSGVIGA